MVDLLTIQDIIMYCEFARWMRGPVRGACVILTPFPFGQELGSAGTRPAHAQ